MPSNEVSLTVDFKNVKLVQEIIKKFTDEATRLEERNGILYSHIELLNKALDVLCPLVARTIDFLPSEQFTLIAATREALDNVTYIQNKEYRENTNQDYYKHAEKTALVRLCGVLGVLTENNDLATAALLAATRIERLEKKIPALNVDLAEASMHAYNGEVARMKLEAENARLTAELAELNDKAQRELREYIAELEEQAWNLNLENERMEEAYWIDESIAPDGTLKPSVRKLLERLEKAETDLRLGDDLVKALDNRIAELEAENERLSQLLHDEMSQLEIATDLGNKRWTALNKIYEHGEKHNTNWCKRKAQEGLGIKNA